MKTATLPFPLPFAPEDWASALPVIEPLANSLECGVLLIGADQKIVLVSEPMAALLGAPVAEIAAMTPADLMTYVAGLVDDAPDRLRQRRLLPGDTSNIVCEEFELSRPSRSVIRWVARRLDAPWPAQIVVCSDITAEVDLTCAYERMAVTDRLTSLANRRGAEQALRREVLRAQRYGEPLSFVLLDIDHFKQINDTYGHNTGDRILRHVAQVIARELREIDVAARWGGEEFLVLLPRTTLEQAQVCADRIRAAVAASSDAQGPIVTISGGAATLGADEGATDAISRADAQLYRAKASGRNRIC
jgi:diguanylate cyclase (GGDEF)-like protein